VEAASEVLVEAVPAEAVPAAVGSVRSEPAPS